MQKISEDIQRYFFKEIEIKIGKCVFSALLFIE